MNSTWNFGFSGAPNTSGTSKKQASLIPILDLGPADSYDEVQAATPLAIREGNGNRMRYAAWAPRPDHTICVAHSRDGIHWERERDGRGIEQTLLHRSGLIAEVLTNGIVRVGNVVCADEAS